MKRGGGIFTLRGIRRTQRDERVRESSTVAGNKQTMEGYRPPLPLGSGLGAEVSQNPCRVPLGIIAKIRNRRGRGKDS